MTKRTQERTGEERAKSKSMMNLVSKTVGRSSTAQSSSASDSPGDIHSTKSKFGSCCNYGETVAKDTNENPASSSQTRQSLVNPNSSAGRPEATDTTQRVIDNDWPNNFKISAPQ